MQRIECDIAIVGGAVAGAMLACNLRDTGLRVVVLEATPEIPEVNRGDSLAPCTVARLAATGALPGFERRGAVRVNSWKAIGPERETLLHVRIADAAPAPFNYVLCLPHPLLEAALIETALSSGTIDYRRSARVSGLLRDDRGAVSGVRAVSGAGPLEVRARLVVGADGSGSLVRQQAGIATDIQTYAYQYLMLTCRRSPDQPADENTEVWGADGFCGLYPITADWVRCPVQAVPGELMRWRNIGLQAVAQEMQGRYPYFDKMTPIGKDLHVYKILRHHVKTYVADGVALIGDAAHCTPPYYGMGMNMAMRDGHHLAQLVVPLLQGGARATRDALLPYEERCRTFNQFVITASFQYGEVGAAHHANTAAVREHLARSTALDPDVMAVIYADYDAPSPSEPEPARVSRRHLAGVA
ncbi:MAG TPA: NAD(P)/FAD-dependent oxidoreductase [Steroidobacteraceae bacterium]